MSYSKEDIRRLLSGVFCYGCLRCLGYEHFATTGRFAQMNEPITYDCSHHVEPPGVFEANTGSRRCMDCLALNNVPNNEEPWLIIEECSSRDRGFCKNCGEVFEANYQSMNRRQRRAQLCYTCWDEEFEQFQWTRTAARLRQMMKHIQEYLSWVEVRRWQHGRRRLPSTGAAKGRATAPCARTASTPDLDKHIGGYRRFKRLRPRRGMSTALHIVTIRIKLTEHALDKA